MERNRICEDAGSCVGRVLLSKDGNCLQDIVETVEQVNELVAAVQKWSDEHPPKTYAQDFFEKFPNVPKDDKGMPHVCREYIYAPRFDKCYGCDDCCTDCWNEPMEV